MMVFHFSPERHDYEYRSNTEVEANPFAIQNLDQFSSEIAKSTCSDVHPSYVTRVIKQLNKEGVLNRHLESNKEIYCWSKPNPLDIENWVANQVNGEQIKSSPVQERPRELLLQNGPASLTDAQLIAILIRVGIPGESAIHAGRRISIAFRSEQLAKLVDASLPELRAISKAIRKDSYAQIMAGIELGRRVSLLRDRINRTPERIRGSDDAIRYCMKEFSSTCRGRCSRRISYCHARHSIRSYRHSSHYDGDTRC